jgi:hypothetical protein
VVYHVLADPAALRARRAIEQAASAWVEADNAAERLWERGQLAAAVADVGARTTTARPHVTQAPSPTAAVLAPSELVVRDRCDLARSEVGDGKQDVRLRRTCRADPTPEGHAPPPSATSSAQAPS